MSKRIAPNLQAFVDYWIDNAMKDHRPVVQAELRALLSVAKYARIWAATDPYPSSTDARLNALHRAIQRLDKVSAKEKP